MLSPDEIREKSFKKDLMGYNVEEVENFLRIVTESYEMAYRDNAELQKKLNALEGQLEKFRSEEDVLKYAILNAQKMNDNLLREANKRAELIINDANIKAENVVERAKDSVSGLREEFGVLKSEVERFRDDIFERYKAHIELLRDMPVFSSGDDGDDVPEPTQEDDDAPPVKAEPVAGQPDSAYQQSPPEYMTRSPVQADTPAPVQPPVDEPEAAADIMADQPDDIDIASTRQIPIQSPAPGYIQASQWAPAQQAVETPEQPAADDTDGVAQTVTPEEPPELMMEKETISMDLPQAAQSDGGPFKLAIEFQKPDTQFASRTDSAAQEWKFGPDYDMDSDGGEGVFTRMFGKKKKRE